jgi:hypothetical protein
LRSTDDPKDLKYKVELYQSKYGRSGIDLDDVCILQVGGGWWGR